MKRLVPKKLMLPGLSRSSRFLAAVVAALIFCATAAAAVVGIQLHQEAGERAEHDVNRLAVVLAEQMSRLLEGVDLVLTGIDRDKGLSGLNTPEQFQAIMGTEAIHAELAARVSGLPLLDRVAVVGADGGNINSSSLWPPPVFSAADRAYFQVMRAADAPLRYISDPLISRVNGNPTVFVLRRIAAPDGRFLGVLAAAVRLPYLKAFYAAIDLPEGTAVTLLRRDGVVLADSPSTRRLGTPVMPPASAWYPAVAAGGGAYWSPGWLDGEPRWVSVRLVPGFPVVVDVSMTRNAIYAEWHRQMVAIGIVAGSVSTFLALLLRALVIQFRTLEDTQAVLRRKSVLLETTLANMEQGLVMVAADRTVGVINQRAAKLLELPPELTREGVLFDDILTYQSQQGEFPEPNEELEALRGRGGMMDHVHTCQRRRPNGTVLEIRSVPLAGGGMIRTYTDITERVIAEKRIIHAARHDVLTALPNRGMFAERLEEAMVEVRRTGTGLAVLFLDLDRFKLVNDTLGHAAGDELLRQVADRMRTVMREGDMLARMGGDEFALVMPDLPGPEAATAIAKRLQAVVREPYTLPQGPASVGISIGIACYPANGGSADEVLNHADLALYRAKTMGRDGWCLFDAGVDAREHDERVLVNALQFALREDQFMLAYQPIWDIRGGRIVGAEALVRWHHPIMGIISPAEFIPLAERSNLIVALGHWVLQEACREAVSWALPVSVSVNVAPAQLRHPEFIGDLRAVLAVTGLPPARLKLEITESQLLEETEETFAMMAALHDLGVRLSLDDFGTGYSSLSALRSFPFSDVKIDRGFTQGIAQDARSRGLIESILQVCRVLNLECVAEGVETTEQLELLQSLGCTHAQGYLIGRPEPPTRLRRTLWSMAAEQQQEFPANPVDAEVAIAL